MKKICSIILTISILAGCKTDRMETIRNEIKRIEALEAEMSIADRRSLNELYAEYALAQPDDSLSMNYLGTAVQYFQLVESMDTAIRFGNEFIARYDSNELTRTVYLSMAKAHLKLHNSDSAIYFFEQAQKISQLEQSELKLLGKAFSQLAGTNTPKGQNAMIKNANIHAAIGETAEAKHLYEKYVELYPKTDLAPYAYTRWADLLEQEGNLVKAEEILKTLIEKYPDDNFANDARITLEKGLLGKTDEEKLEIITGGFTQ